MAGSGYPNAKPLGIIQCRKRKYSANFHFLIFTKTGPSRNHKIYRQRRNAFADKRQLCILKNRRQFWHIGLQNFSKLSCQHIFSNPFVVDKTRFLHTGLFRNNFLHNFILKFPDSIVLLTNRFLEGCHTPPSRRPCTKIIFSSCFFL